MTAAHTEPAENQRIVVVDRFPVKLTAPDGTEHRDCRLILTRPHGEARAWCWMWRDARPEPELLMSTEWTTPTSECLAGRNPRIPWMVDTLNGVWRVESSQGCGCGSALRRFRPWEPMRMGRL